MILKLSEGQSSSGSNRILFSIMDRVMDRVFGIY